ncbi:methionyl-tRNA formyltransferase [Candidatus Erwinia haradaeae]|uniref:Methionyl-tRNA formyltransferase n=1 Tax=Candidatus Erwinia haradaeae TaxID=1922217 RepID=A0A803FSZ2_9GAMM|nr:methionyl-tRNA formyltransferase [Candidatus Erwinia haradaeae]VFP87335.1 Methionyl-tRNA formyltransferase [Candidatus Erwinia haradaeae]
MLSIMFAGTPDFALRHFYALLSAGKRVVCVLTKPDRPVGRGHKMTANSVKKLADKNKIPILQPESLHSKEIKELISTFNIDIMVVVAYGLMLPQNILDIPILGCINVHGSLLPRWRGAAPIQRALCAGDRETGVTIIRMNSRLDAGDILYQATCPIESFDTSATLYNKLANLGVTSLLKTLDMLGSKTDKSWRQNEQEVSYAHKLTVEEARINWSLSAIQLERFIRAFNPWPGSYFFINNTLIKVWKASVFPPVSGYLIGQIIRADKHGIQVVTSDGILNLEELQIAGKKIVTTQDLLNSRYNFFIPGSIMN